MECKNVTETTLLARLVGAHYPPGEDPILEFQVAHGTDVGRISHRHLFQLVVLTIDPHLRGLCEAAERGVRRGEG